MSGSHTALPGLSGDRPRSNWFCYECTANFLEPSRNAGNDLPLCPACRSDVVEERNPTDDHGSAFISDYTAAREREEAVPEENHPDPAEMTILQDMFGPPRMYGNRLDGVNPSGSIQSGSRAGSSNWAGGNRLGGGSGSRGGSGSGEASRSGFEQLGGPAGGLMGLMGELFNPQGQGGGNNASGSSGSRVRTFQFGTPGSGFAGGGASISFGGSNTLHRGPNGRIIEARDPFPFPFTQAYALGRPVTGGTGSNSGRQVADDDGDSEWEDENPFGAGAMPAPFVYGGPGGGVGAGGFGQGGGGHANDRQAGGGAGQAPPDLEELIQGLIGYMNGGQMGGMPFHMGGSGGEGGFRGNVGDYVFSQEGLDDVMERMMEAAGTSNAPPPASELVIKGLPRVKMDEGAVEASPECTICQDELKVGDEVVRIPCKHVFHEDCVVPWLKTNGTCPVCRFSLVPEEDREGARQARNEDQNMPNIPANPLQAVMQGIQNLFGGGVGNTVGGDASGVDAVDPSEGISSPERMPGGFPRTTSSSSGHSTARLTPSSTAPPDPSSGDHDHRDASSSRRPP